MRGICGCWAVVKHTIVQGVRAAVVAIDAYCLQYVVINEMSLAMKCPACGDEVQSDARFCSHCGARTTDGASAAILPYELPWDTGKHASAGADFHAEDTIIPDFMPPASSSVNAHAGVHAGTAETAVPAAAGRKRVLAALILVLLSAAGGVYFLRAADRPSVSEPAGETVVADQPSLVPDGTEGDGATEVPAQNDGHGAEVEVVSVAEASLQLEVAPAPPPKVVVRPAKPAPVSPSWETVKHKAAVPPPAPGPEPQRAWLTALKADLAVCDGKSFFPRIACREKARWKHCAPERWNTVPECEVNSSKR